MKESENKIVIVGFRLDRCLYNRIRNQMPMDLTLSEFIRNILLEKVDCLEQDKIKVLLNKHT